MLLAKHKDVEFGVGDRIRVTQKIVEAGKSRSSIFEGMVIGIRGRDNGTSFIVRRVGEAGIGIERIFPLFSPTIEKITVIKKGYPGVRHAKLFYTRSKSQREIDEIYTRSSRKNLPQKPKTKRKHARAKRK